MNGPQDQAPTQQYGADTRSMPSDLAATVADEPRATVDPASIPRYERIDRYVVLDMIGRGGMGAVYGAYDPRLRRRVALKIIRPDTAGDEGAARLLREARAMARLSHPNVLPVYDAGEFEGGVFIAMEHISGLTLRKWLAKAERPWAEVLDVLLRAGDGLAAAHAQGLVHRDFKPDNVMIDDRGRVLVLDFGLVTPWAAPEESQQLRELYDVPVDDEITRLTMAGRAMGTPAYMAPEQHTGGSVDGRADQYAFCVTLYEALHGTRPFAGQSLAALEESKRRGMAAGPRKSAPAALEDIIARGLAPKPEARWHSLPELLATLRKAPRIRRRRIWAAGLALGGLVALAVGWPRAPRCDRLAALSVPAPATAPLDQHAVAWNERAHALCEAEPSLDDRMQWCLEEVRAELSAAAAAAGPVEVRPPSVCDDASRLQAWAQGPPKDRDPVLALRTRLVEARARGATAETLREPLALAEASGDLRVLAEARLALARALPPGSAEGSRAGFEAAASAMDANDFELEARGWLVALEHLAANQSRSPEALAWREVVQAEIERAGSEARLVARLALALDGPLRAADQADLARDTLARALRHPKLPTIDPGLQQRLRDASR